tara:strand:+ start:174 stop:590 length:417 start_codon:yes stop_codon:yes gene_type:complete
MTNKMPEAGKRYIQICEKNIPSHCLYDSSLGEEDGIKFIHLINITRINADFKWPLTTQYEIERFWETFEELPKTKEEPKSQERDEVQLAVDELKQFILENKKLDTYKFTLEGVMEMTQYIKLEYRAQNLINALNLEKK